MGTDPLLDEIVDRRFRIIKRLGTGGMGSVYLAEHLTLGRKFAIKVLREEFNEQPEFLARFLRESRAATTIDHPNVIEVIDTGTLPDDRAYYVMEYLQGEDLAKTLRREGRLPWSRVRHIALQICDALGAAHDIGIVHRDLKPANCFRMTRAGDPDFIKLLDFGIVKLLGESGSPLTNNGALLGTTHYMAPEQAMGLPVDHRADIYALGVMVYQLLTGRHPYPGRSGVEMLYAILHEVAVPLRDAAGDALLPAGIVEVVAAAMHRDRDQRIASMADLAEALRGLAEPQAADGVVGAPRETPTCDRGLFGLVSPSHKPTMARNPAREPSFDSKVTADRTPTPHADPESLSVEISLDSAVPVIAGEGPTRRTGDVLPVAYSTSEGEPAVSASTKLRDASRSASGTPTRLTGDASASSSGGSTELGGEASLPMPVSGSPWWRRRAPLTAVAALSFTAIALALWPARVDEPEAVAPLLLTRSEEPPAASVARAPQAVAPAPAREVPAEQPDAEQPVAERTLTEPPAPASRPAPRKPDVTRTRKQVDAVLAAIKQKIQRGCYSRLTVETVEIDVWIDAKTGAVRRSQVAPPHDRTSTRACVERVFAGADFPPFAGKDYRQLLKTQIRPKGA